MATCRSCGAPIQWAKTTGGKPIPLDAKPQAGGNIRLSRGVALVGAAGSGDRVSHFATCPNAGEHRRTR